MKLLHITDPHLVPPGEPLHGLDPYDRLTRCIDDILEHHGDAKACVITGDLAHRGQAPAYAGLRVQLDRLPMPWFALLGNHDKRAEYATAFGDAPQDGSGFIQGSFDTPQGRLLMLDTLDEGRKGGLYCERRRAWLGEQLEQAAGRPVYLFMHHPPFDIGLPCLDRIGLEDQEGFAKVLAGHSNIRHLFFGHVHRPICGSWRGLAFSTMRGLNHQVPFDLHTVTQVPKSHEPPAYAVVFMEADQVTIHFHDFLDRSTLPPDKW